MAITINFYHTLFRLDSYLKRISLKKIQNKNKETAQNFKNCLPPEFLHHGVFKSCRFQADLISCPRPFFKARVTDAILNPVRFHRLDDFFLQTIYLGLNDCASI